MNQYENFAVCTAQALDYTCAVFDAEIAAEDKEALLGVYRVLPAFDDVRHCLAGLADDRFELYAFSNGTAAAVEGLLNAAGIRECFLGVVSVDDLKTFKPNPAVYQRFLTVTGAQGSNAWLVSGNPFDVIGAVSAGMRAAWVKRSAAAVFDPWGVEPTITVSGLTELGERIIEYQAAG